jgi:hypothetical protein
MNILAVKDSVTIDQYYKQENQSEDKINRLREPSGARARKLLD